VALDLSQAYEKHPKVAIRREEFGGLAYHYGNRRLVFLKAPALVELVETLADFASARDALTAHVPAGSSESFERALSGLLSSEVIRVR
jgi:putative mycofactocin binding protein MftB